MAPEWRWQSIPGTQTGQGAICSAGQMEGIARHGCQAACLLLPSEVHCLRLQHDVLDVPKASTDKSQAGRQLILGHKLVG